MAMDVKKPAATTVDIPLPRIDVMDRAVSDPFGLPSRPILLRNPDLVCRWVNTDLKGGSQLSDALDSGYLKVRPEYLANPEVFQFQTSPDGYVTRGQRHQEVLMYTTAEHVKRRQWAKTAENVKRMQGSREELAQAAAGKFGDEAGDYVHKSVKINDQIERMERQPDGN